MSIANGPVPSQTTIHDDQSTWSDSAASSRVLTSQIPALLQSVAQKIVPVRPLQDYVAFNPYAGFADRHFLAARQALKAVADLDMMMPVSYYRAQYLDGRLLASHIDAAVDEMVADQVSNAETIDVNRVISFMLSREETAGEASPASRATGTSLPRFRTFVQVFDETTGSNWQQVIVNELSKFCSAHYDQGQSLWSSPYRDLPLFQAWKLAMRHDRAFEISGVGGFRRFVSKLPHQPQAAIPCLLQHLGVPEEAWEDLLLCEAMSTPGWSAWTRQKQEDAKAAGEFNDDFAALLAIRLAYQVALSEHFNFRLSWSSMRETRWDLGEAEHNDDESLLRYALLKAHEIAYRESLVSSLSAEASKLRSPSEESSTSSGRKLAQMVFCIDVRSQRVRSGLEATSDEIETFGFAGFFGLPIEHVAIGQQRGTPQVPALIEPQYRVLDDLDEADDAVKSKTAKKRSMVRYVRKLLKDFQSSAAGCFGFVESSGWWYGPRLIQRLLGINGTAGHCDGFTAEECSKVGPDLKGLEQQGLTPSSQLDLAESILRGIGIINDFARLVVFCGHGSETANNPIAAGLDCGACGGHSGEPNARLAAKLLNQPFVREGLAKRGIAIPQDTVFVGALHNTTTESLTFFDQHRVPSTHLGDLVELESHCASASEAIGIDHAAEFSSRDRTELMKRSRDWSEVRPEWGLAGNAAFIVAPRKLTQSISLGNRAFLHSYDYRTDPDFKVLEQIMTAPMVVAYMINMQYYASTVDPALFGSGNKTVHNVVGGFGLLSGNGGDLMTGLPSQSIHDGQNYQHHPLRLMVFIAAPTQEIERIIQKHATLQNLLAGDWLQLISIDDATCKRYSSDRGWNELTPSPKFEFAAAR